jgi:hypothetical protein
LKKISIVYEYFDTGKSWEQCGAYENMKLLMKQHPGADGCYTEEDIRARYDRLSELIENLKAGGKFLERSGFRESGGVYIHIGRNGELLFGGGGCHRLAVAQKLNLERIPAQVGVVHRQFLKNNLLKQKYFN